MGLHMEEFRFAERAPSMADIVRQLSEYCPFPVECRYYRHLSEDSIHGPLETIRQIIQPAASPDLDANPWRFDDKPGSLDFCISAARSSDRRRLGFLSVSLNVPSDHVHLICHMPQKHKLVQDVRLALRQLGGRHVGLTRSERQRVREFRARERRVIGGFGLLLLTIFACICAFFGPGPGGGAVVLFLFLLILFNATKRTIRFSRRRRRNIRAVLRGLKSN